MSGYTSKKTIKKLNDAWIKRDQSKRSKKKNFHPWQIFRNNLNNYSDKIVSEILKDLDSKNYK